ncbi:unnamed protein product [Brachionus calyciflorus]|uniref:Uncharacterized protein n=1 Tax=Brachionus calyciflorus TaxID=104777 RepID=A0A814LXE9_9BILA|nr:unnamed protein product [Brachionus calyciflorus]
MSGKIPPLEIQSNKIRIKVQKLNQLVNRRSSVLPNIYAKAKEINRRLSLSNTALNSDFQSTSSMFQFENMSDKDKENYLKAYRTRKRSIIVSKYLDEDMQQKFEQVKYSLNPSRRQSIFENTSSTSINPETENLNEILKKNSCLEETSSFNLKNKSPRFGSTLSKDGQYALMKSLEDTIVYEIESKYPEFKGSIPRTSTALYRKSLTASSEFNSNITKSSQESKYDDLYYSKSEFFETEPKESITESELNRRLLVTQHIDNAMDILDKIRINSQKIQAKQKILNSKKVNYLDVMPNGRVVGVVKNKSASSLNLDTTSEKIKEDLEKLKFEPIIKYSEWKNTWVKELENV